MGVYIDAKLHPRIQFEVFFSRWLKVDAMIDTGFSGGLSLPEAYKKLFHDQPIAFQRYTLADGTIKVHEVYEMKLLYKNREDKVTAVFNTSNESFIGIEFLKSHTLTVDFKSRRISLK